MTKDLTVKVLFLTILFLFGGLGMGFIWGIELREKEVVHTRAVLLLTEGRLLRCEHYLQESNEAIYPLEIK